MRNTQLPLLCLTIVTLAFAMGNGIARGGIIADGGFESAAVGTYSPSNETASLGDGWTVTSGTVGVENSSGGNGVPHSGSQMAYLDPFFTLNTISQTITTSPGQSYTFSYYVADSPSSNDLFSATFGGQVVSTAVPSGGTGSAGDYVLQSFNETATSSSTIITFSGQATTGGPTEPADQNLLLDDVSVVVAPEPAGLALLICAPFLLRRRRRAS